jgi:hypothetical protein
MELVSQPYSIIPVYQGQRGFSLFVMVDQGGLELLLFGLNDLPHRRVM